MRSSRVAADPTTASQPAPSHDITKVARNKKEINKCFVQKPTVNIGTQGTNHIGTDGDQHEVRRILVSEAIRVEILVGLLAFKSVHERFAKGFQRPQVRLFGF